MRLKRSCPHAAGAYATKIFCVLGLVCNGIFACLALELQAGLGDVDREGGALRHHRRRASQAELLGNAGKAGAEIAATKSQKAWPRRCGKKRIGGSTSFTLIHA